MMLVAKMLQQQKYDGYDDDDDGYIVRVSGPMWLDEGTRVTGRVNAS